MTRAPDRSHAEHLLATERARQLTIGRTPEHDERHRAHDLADAARAYLTADPTHWPWERAEFKPKSELRNLIRAGALAQAALDKAPEHPDAALILDQAVTRLTARLAEAATLLAPTPVADDPDEPTTEFAVRMTTTITVPTRLIPQAMLNDGPPKRLWDWPPDLLQAIEERLPTDALDPAWDVEEVTVGDIPSTH